MEHYYPLGTMVGMHRYETYISCPQKELVKQHGLPPS